MTPLSLKATTIEECDVISTLCQDSIFHFQHHDFDESNGCFTLMLNRFCWEDMDKFEEEGCYFRVLSALCIHNVESIVVNKGFQNNRHAYLNLLAIHASDREINLLFSDNKHICVSSSKKLVLLVDLNDKHPTLSVPFFESL